MHDVPHDELAVLPRLQVLHGEREGVLEMTDSCAGDLTVGSRQLATERVASAHAGSLPRLLDFQVDRLVGVVVRDAQVDAQLVVPRRLDAVYDKPDSVALLPAVEREGALDVGNRMLLAGTTSTEQYESQGGQP